jgi:O-antigen ligase
LSAPPPPRSRASDRRAVLRRAVRLAFAIPPLLVIIAFVCDDRIPVAPRIAIAALAVLATARPRDALLVVAAIGPFFDLILTMWGTPPNRGLEALVVAFLAGWLVGEPPKRSGAAARPEAAMWLFGTIVVASITTLALQLRRADPAFFQFTLDRLRQFYFSTEDMAGVAHGAKLVEGVALLAAVMELADATPRFAFALMRMLAASGVTAAALSLLLAGGIALPATLARQASFGKSRFVAHISDVNAAGSYYVLLLGLAFGMAASSRGRRRQAWLMTIVLLGVGLALTGSRSAMLAAVLTACGAGAWIVVRRRVQPRMWRVAAIAAVIVAAAVGIMFVPGSLLAGSSIRREFAMASFHMIAARPWFGVGVGRYAPLSPLVFSPWLGNTYNAENAHNYLLQICAELGLAGAAAFLWLLAASLSPAVAALRDRSRDFVSTGLLAGAVAFLITCLSGHPFLVREAAFPFWMVLGLATVAARSATPTVSTRRAGRTAAIAAIAVVVASVPFRTEIPRLRLPPSEDGFSAWQTGADGRRFREAGEHASLFVGPTVTGVEIPLRLMPDRRGVPLLVVDQEPYWAMHRTVVGETWTILRVTLPGADPLLPYQRINLSVSDHGGAPENSRAAGVGVGELRITRSRE